MNWSGSSSFKPTTANGGRAKKRVLIPKSAHGTNFATAAMAGYPDGIVYLSASDEGTIDMDDFAEKINSYGTDFAES